MNQPDSDTEDRSKQLAAMLAKPPLLPDPVFPNHNYLEAFGRSFFQGLLQQWGKGDLMPELVASGSNHQVVMLRVGWVAFWAFDFEEKSDQGVSGHDEFLDRVKEPIRRPPPEMAAFTMEQHILAHGVLKLQITQGPAVPGQYEVARLKTIGWYAAQLVSPQT